MHHSIININKIKDKIQSEISKTPSLIVFPKIIAVSKSFASQDILPLIKYNHQDFGENKVQEAISKWSEIKNKNADIKLHLIGKLQSNKVKLALKIFDYIHSLDNEKLAKKISEEQLKYEIKPKIFIQVNIANEPQKSGIEEKNLEKFFNYCLRINLNIIGTMCIPPINEDPEKYFIRMNILNKKLKLKELSIGMSSDYISALKNKSTFLRIGTSIFGERKTK